MGWRSAKGYVMRTNVLALASLFIGAILVYGGVTNRHPLDMVKLTLQGKDLKDARKIKPE